MKKTHYVSVLLIISSICALIGLHICAPVCDKLVELASGNMAYMKCHYTSQVATIIAVIILIVGIERMLNRNSFKILIFSMGLIMIAITLKVPFVPGVCKLNTMACNSTIIWIRISGIIAIIAGIIDITIKQDKKNI
ncbi:DUF4418 family protein [uncultured Clostridium sp.]|uniref:DUF4418 family protein n=1 Tax=uncultured Clostridium sp. TaxID=59620 RepID=UPI002582F313|nr:DUF4418 family protein [uncultured Clostridium sp.]